MLNKVFIQGNLVKDPDYREFPNGDGSVCTMRIASSRKFNVKGQQHEETTFVKVQAFGKLAQTCRQFLAKGHPVIFEGKLKLNEWQGKDGQNRQELIVNAESLEFLPGRSDHRDNPPRPPQENTAPRSDYSAYAPPSQHSIDKGNAYQPQPEVPDAPQDDDIPF